MILNNQFELKIKKFFNYNLQKKKINLFFQQYPEIQQECNNLLFNIPQWLSLYNILFGVLHNMQLKKCKTCNKIIKFNKRHKIYCNNICKNHDKQLLQKSVEKYKKTCLLKYGVDNIHKISSVIEQTKQTCIQRYGVDNPAKKIQIQEKIKQTNKQKYGCENVFQSQLIKNKIKQTCLVRFGAEHPLQSQKIKLKVENTNLKRYRH